MFETCFYDSLRSNTFLFSNPRPLRSGTSRSIQTAWSLSRPTTPDQASSSRRARAPPPFVATGSSQLFRSLIQPELQDCLTQISRYFGSFGSSFGTCNFFDFLCGSFLFGDLVVSFVGFQIAYKTAAHRFTGKLAELFLVLSDNQPVAAEAGASGFQPIGRGQKHHLDDDQMSTESGSKRKDQSSSAEKVKRNFSKNKPKPKPK